LVNIEAFMTKLGSLNHSSLYIIALLTCSAVVAIVSALEKF